MRLELDAAALPLAPGRRGGARRHWGAIRRARRTGGEDYELCAVLPPERRAEGAAAGLDVDRRGPRGTGRGHVAGSAAPGAERWRRLGALSLAIGRSRRRPPRDARGWRQPPDVDPRHSRLLHDGLASFPLPSSVRGPSSGSGQAISRTSCPNRPAALARSSSSSVSLRVSESLGSSHENHRRRVDNCSSGLHPSRSDHAQSKPLAPWFRGHQPREHDDPLRGRVQRMAGRQHEPVVAHAVGHPDVGRRARSARRSTA